MKVVLEETKYLPAGEYTVRRVGSIRTPSNRKVTKYEVTSGKFKGARFLLEDRQ